MKLLPLVTVRKQNIFKSVMFIALVYFFPIWPIYFFPIWPNYYDNLCGNRSPHKVLWVARDYYQNLFFIFIACLYLIRYTFYISIAQCSWFFVYNSVILTLAFFLKLNHVLCRQHVHHSVVLSMANIYKNRSGYRIFVISYIHMFHSRFPVRESQFLLF